MTYDYLDEAIEREKRRSSQFGHGILLTKKQLVYSVYRIAAFSLQRLFTSPQVMIDCCLQHHAARDFQRHCIQPFYCIGFQPFLLRSHKSKWQFLTNAGFERDNDFDRRPCRKYSKLNYFLIHWLSTSQPCRIQVACLIDSQRVQRQLKIQSKILLLRMKNGLT
ncbi:MAG: hypothetical protein COB20_04810 [SAR86 cluster bacterium]|uniref:Uncharacterized protein n=1 Tax=SAR86 cluster bacterium TaxID=2030880 RepID=A0A2A4XAU9_9GAMM|nr:MAG: hypothetical protein COB20_04810 [SAR86 cluster bacterium]